MESRLDGGRGEQQATITISVVVGIVALTALAGWWIDVDQLRSLQSGLVATKPWTAVALLALAVALAGAATARRVAAALGSAVAILLGGMSLLEYALDWSFGADDWLFGPAVRAEGVAHPGRMAPATALTLVGLGVALIAVGIGRTRLAHVLGSLSCWVGALVLTGYLYGVESLRRAGPFASVAAPTAVCLMLLGIGVTLITPGHGLAAASRRGRGAGHLVRWSVPIVVLSMLAIGWLCQWGERAGWYESPFAVAIMVIASVVVMTMVLWRSALHIAELEDQATHSNELLHAANEQLEARVRERTARLAGADALQGATLGALAQGVALVRTDRRVDLLNRAGEELLGYDAAELTALFRSGSWETYREDGTTIPVAERPIGQTLLSGTTVRDAVVGWRRRSGDRVLLSVTTTPVHTASGELDGVVVAFADITDRRTAERDREAHVLELAELNAELERAVAIKDHFLGTATHDMRNPLTAILGFSSMLQHDERMTPEARIHALEAVARQARRLDALVEDLLSISVIEGGGLTVHPTRVELHAVLGQIVADAALGLPVAIEGDLDATVHADPHRLAQMLTNLLVNAQRYGAPPITVIVAAGEGTVDLTVTDQGPGVDPEFRDALFDKFSVANRAQSRAVRGTGLGLAIVQGLAHAQGGAVWYEPNEPNGARFVIRLPADAPSLVVDLDAATTEHA